MSPFLAALRAKIGTDLLVLPAAAAAVFDDAGRLLLAKHADDGTWGIPGGMVEPGEAPETGAVRELLGETGLEAEPLGLVGAYGGPEFLITYPGGDRTSYVLTVHGCRLTGGSERPDGEEVLEVGWFDEAETARVARPRDLAKVLPDAFGWWAGRNGHRG